MDFARSAHVSLLNESLPFLEALLCFCPSSSQTGPPHSGLLLATLNYHGWKEKQIRRAWNSEPDNPSPTVQRENNSNEQNFFPSVEGLDCCLRHNQRTWSFLQDKQHTIFAALSHTYCILPWYPHQDQECSAILCTTPVWIPPYSLQFTTQWGSRSCYTSRQWTRCEKLLQCFSLHRQLEVIRNAQLNLLSAEQADFILIHTNMFYHVCTQGQPALHQLTTAARGSVKAPKSLTHCTEQHSF